MATGELFDDLRELRTPLSDEQRKAAIDDVVMRARFGVRYFYTLREACAILHASYDEMNTLMHLYKLDVVALRDAYRVPWWSIAEYLIDQDDDLEGAIDEYLRSRHRRPGQTVGSGSARPA